MGNGVIAYDTCDGKDYKTMRDIIQNFLKLFHTYKQSIYKTCALALVFLAGCFLSFTMGRRLGQRSLPPAPEPSAIGTPSTAETLNGTPHFEFPPSASYSDATPSNAVLMSPDILNLAYLYEDGADTSQPSYSYAGRLYDQLAGLDAKWSSGIYDLYHYTPERLAALLGLPVETVTTPSGVIPEFKNVNLQFLDGDGQACGSTSNAKSIVSMANILYYHGILNDAGQLKAYVSDMWEASHGYSVHMGEIYYCDGSCLEHEEISTDVAAASDTSMVPAASESGEAADHEQSADESSPSSSEAEEDVGAEQAASDAGAADKTGEMTDHAATAASGQTTNNAATAASGQMTDHAATSASDSNHNSKGPGETISAEAEAAPDTTDGTGIPVNPCPGHIDFSINITVKGITEANGLFQYDQQAGSAAGQGNWKGWDEPAMEQVRYLSGQDWYQTYGINTTDLFVRNPLTSAEIDIYMTMVPENTSQQKKDFIRYALSSVGKIPYYWGGKPSSPGYTGNDFGSVTAQDEDGRFLKGLDCSGWINWVYWSVTGRGLGAASTGTLVSSGRAITKDQLVPGDICIRTGPSAHVVIFLGWAADGQMLCIQETSGNVNNVEVGIAASDWQSYRRILE